VLVYDAGVTRKGVLYLVMELLEGRSVRAEIGAQKRMDIGRCLRISERVASVLATAHTKGVIHRDIKPRASSRCASPSSCRSTMTKAW
jgi:eukaryotic-like serine/threonine-protein kinase